MPLTAQPPGGRNQRPAAYRPATPPGPDRWRGTSGDPGPTRTVPHCSARIYSKPSTAPGRSNFAPGRLTSLRSSAAVTGTGAVAEDGPRRRSSRTAGRSPTCAARPPICWTPDCSARAAPRRGCSTGCRPNNSPGSWAVNRGAGVGDRRSAPLPRLLEPRALRSGPVRARSRPPRRVRHRRRPARPPLRRQPPGTARKGLIPVTAYDGGPLRQWSGFLSSGRASSLSGCERPFPRPGSERWREAREPAPAPPAAR